MTRSTVAKVPIRSKAVVDQVRATMTCCLATLGTTCSTLATSARSGSGTTDANSTVIADFVTGQDKFEADITDSASPEYTEVAAAGVTSVQEAIQFYNSNNLFNGRRG